MIKAILFDFDGVMSENHKVSVPFIKTAEKLRITKEELAKAVYNKELWGKARRGEIPEPDYWDRVAELLDLPKTKASWLRDALLTGLSVRTELVQFIRELRPRYKVALVSNAIPSFVKVWKELGLNELFDLIVNSASEQRAKPDPIIFLSTCSRLEVEPSECISVDDKNKNIQTANRLGMHSILYTTSHQLIGQVKQILANEASKDKSDAAKGAEHETVAELSKVLNLQRKYLQILEVQSAKFGPLHVPAHVLLQIDDVRSEIAETESKISQELSGATARSSFSLHDLPPRKDFIGRSKELLELKAAVLQDAQIIEVEGISGTGKTALAIELTYQLIREEVFFAIAWISGRDMTPTLDEILDQIASILGCNANVQPDTKEKRREVLGFLRKTRALVVLDSFEKFSSAELVRFIEDIAEPSKVLVLTQQRTFKEARMIILQGLDEVDARALIESEMSRLELNAAGELEESTCSALIKLTGGNPLALKWAVSQIKYKGSLPAVVEEIESSRGELFTAIFGSTWSLLTEESKSLVMAFPVCATEVQLDALSDIANLNADVSSRAIRQLLDLCLVEDTLDRKSLIARYYIHPLTRIFINGILSNSGDEREAMIERACKHFVNKYTRARGHRNWKAYELSSLIDTDYPNIGTLVDWCVAKSRDVLLLELALTFTRYLYNRCRWAERLRIGELALRAAERRQDRQGIIMFLLEDVGWSAAKIGNTAYAKDCLSKISRLLREWKSDPVLDLPWLQSRVALESGAIDHREGRIASAIDELQSGLEAAESISCKEDQQRIRAQLHGELGIIYTVSGDNTLAENELTTAMTLAKDLTDHVRYCKIAFTLADLQMSNRDYQGATKTLDDALHIALELGRTEYEAEIKVRKASILIETGRELAMEAYRAFKGISHAWGMKESLKLMIPHQDAPNT